MKNLVTVLLVFSGGCHSYSVNRLDNQTVVDYCTDAIECQMELIDDGLYSEDYDLEDEDVYQQVKTELCVDQYYDGMNDAALEGCKSEYKQAASCSYEHMPLICNYDLDNSDWYEEYDEDYQEYENETCWKELQAFYECSFWY